MNTYALLFVATLGMWTLINFQSVQSRVPRQFIPSQTVNQRTIDPYNRTLCPETPDNRPSNRVNTTERIAALRAAMADPAVNGGAELQAYLLLMTDDHGGESVSEWDARIKYISGFSGSAGYVIVTKNKSALWTDGRYFLQADQQMDCNWILMKEGQAGYPTGEQWIVSELPPNSRVGAYPNYVSIKTWQSYETALASINSVLVKMNQDLVDYIWTDPSRSPRPNQPPFVHTIEYAGVEWVDKLAQVREKMTAQNAGALAVTVLEESAWLYNLRGMDITSSLFYAYSIVLHDESKLFLNNYDRMINSTEIQDHLQINANGQCRTPGPNCVNVYNYTDVMTHIADAATRGLSVWLDPTANYATYDAAGVNRQVVRSPIALLKSVKNSVERVKFMESIMRDSCAVIEFLAFLESEILAGRTWTEVSAATKLEEYRSTYPNFKGLSFDTISAVGPHASVIHYRPDPSSNETNSVITTTDVYLLDSGGQFLDGTTDVTRTTHYGTPKPIEIEAYTRVLQGSIDLALFTWPEGLYGSDIDALARGPLWQTGWDYNHGTGHGIGYYLSVHEGPGRINIGFSEQYTPLYEGMFFSDEPGYYEDNQYGIRLETLVQVVIANTTNRFNNKNYFGFYPATLVPFEPKLIDYNRLSEKQISYLNQYNARCLNEVGPYLLNVVGNQQAYDWLVARTQPVSVKLLKPETYSSAMNAWLPNISLFILTILATAASVAGM